MNTERKAEDFLKAEDFAVKSDLPNGWVITPLENLGIFINGDRGKNYPNKKALVKEGIPFINAGHLNNDIIEMSNMNFISQERFDLLRSGKVQKNDILYCLRGSLGKTAMVNNIEQGAIASSLIIIRPCEYIDSKYIFYFLLSPLGKSEIEKYDNGSAQPNLSAKSIQLYSVPLPPLNEQRRIVAKLEKLLAKVNVIQDRLSRIPTILKRFRQSVLAAACSGRLTADWREKHLDIESAEDLVNKLKTSYPKTYFDIFEESSNYSIPDSWQFVPLGKLGKLTSGGTPSKSNPEFWEGDIPWISAKDMKFDRIHDSIDHITEEAVNKSSTKKIPRGSILFVVRGMILAHTFPVAITDGIITINQDIKALIPENIRMSEYLFIAIKSIAQNILFSTKEATHGTRRIETDVLKNWAIPLPPLEEQEEIVKRVEALFRKCDRIEQRYQKAKAYTDKLIHSILAKAFRGELVPQDPNRPLQKSG